jgi:hypothetical protein
MGIKEIEKKFIELQCQEPPYTVEEITFIVNQDQDEKLSDAEIEAWIAQTKEAAIMQKSINKKHAERKSDALINDLHHLITKMKETIDDLKNNDEYEPGKNSKSKIAALKEIRLTIMDIANLAGELKKQQDVNISHFYIPINKVEDYFQERLQKWKKEKGINCV